MYNIVIRMYVYECVNTCPQLAFKASFCFAKNVLSIFDKFSQMLHFILLNVKTFYCYTKFIVKKYSVIVYYTNCPNYCFI